MLDTSLGRPARDVAITLARREGGSFIDLGRGRTDADGRCRELLPQGVSLQPAVYRIVFDSGGYYEGRGACARR